MKLRTVLQGLARVVAEEAERNPDFEARVRSALGLTEIEAKKGRFPSPEMVQRPRNRRPAALLDPIELVRQGEDVLRSRLAELTVEQLKDIVADHGMDPGKLVMKWKSPERIIDRIAEISSSRARKGDAFRS